MTGVESEVLAAATDLVNAFGRHDAPAYFAGFAEDATFVFHTTDRVLTSRAQYEDLWRLWEADDDFHVLSCESSEQQVQALGDTAVLSHRVRTTVRTTAGEESLRERESIVFVRRGSRWLAVHEHLSPDPGADPSD